MNKLYLGGVFFLIMLISLFGVHAADNDDDDGDDFNVSQGFAWLYGELVDAEWDLPVDTLSFSILALRGEGDPYDLSEGIDFLRDEGDNDHWGSVSDSAFATLALYKTTDDDLEDEIDWLLDEQEKALTGGDWLIQFLDERDGGICKIIYDDETTEFTINGTTITTTDCYMTEEYWVNFETCIKDGVADLKEELVLDCSISGIKPSILFRSTSEEYYIVDERSPFVIENGCYGSTGACTCRDTGFVSWVLEEVEEHAYTFPYLRSQCRSGASELTFIYLLTDEGIEDLVRLQDTDGSFDGDVFETALAYRALKGGNSAAASKAYDWLVWKQREDGSWEGSVATTAFVLYSVFSQDYVGRPSDPEDVAVCGNGDLELDETCEGLEHPCSNPLDNCVNCQCIPDSQSDCDLAIDECVVDTDCILSDQHCTVECTCEIDVVTGCTSSSECQTGYFCNLRTGECEQESDIPGDSDCIDDGDCEEDERCINGFCRTTDKDNTLVWIIVGIVVLLGLIALYFVYQKYLKGNLGKKKRVFKPAYQPKPGYPTTKHRVPASRPQQRSAPRSGVRSRAEVDLERQLDDSLKRARELLKKK